MNKIKIDKEWLQEQYLTLNKSTNAIVAEFGIAKNTLRRRIKEFGFVKSKEKMDEANSKAKLKHIFPKSELYDLYINKNMSITDLSNHFDVDRMTISNNLRLFKIQKSKTKQNESKDNSCMLRYGVTIPAKSLEIRTKLSEIITSPEVKAKIKKTRIEKGLQIDIEGKSLTEISKELDISYGSLKNWCDRNPNFNVFEFYSYCKDIKDQYTDIERIIKEEFKLEKFDRSLDILTKKYRPDFKLSEDLYLNVDGIFFHSEFNSPDKERHFKVRQVFEQVGKRLVQFRSDELSYKTDIVFSMIRNMIGQTPNKVFARETEIKEVLHGEASLFLDRCHLMGKYNGRHLGLYSEGKLIFILTYRIVQGILKIERVCSELNTNVVGGFSKLLSFIEKTCEYESIKYWTDLRYGTGNYLVSLGFKQEKETLGWKWTDMRHTYNRLYCRANMDTRKLSEKEHANELGLYKIYDAGQRLYTRLKNGGLNEKKS